MANESGALSNFPLEQGSRYRARLTLNGLYSFASRAQVKEKLEEKGFANVVVRKANELPADWTDKGKADWYVEGTWSKGGVTANLNDDSNAVWEAAWKLEAPTPSPTIPKITSPSVSLDAKARVDLLEAWKQYGPLPSAAELQITQAIGRHETNYGNAPPFPGSNNWGAIHAPASEPSFASQDSDGVTGQKFDAHFRKYPTPVDGALGLIKVSHKTDSERRAFQTEVIDNVAEAMYDSKYYGVSTTKATLAQRASIILAYTKALERNVAAIAKALGEPIAAIRSGNAEGKLITKGDYESDKIAAVSSLSLMLFSALALARKRF